MAWLQNATDPNLKEFFGHSGKLLQYQGWNDQLIAPQNSVNYFKSVLDKMGGAAKVKDSYRLFMVPGMSHCQGGDGTDTFDALGALEQWVERGKAPDQILASRMRRRQGGSDTSVVPVPSGCGLSRKGEYR